jgi:hypothetical protein
LVNLFMDFLATLDIVRREPDPEPRVLQTLMQPATEGLIGVAVADETRIELEGLAQERREVLDERFWQTTASEKSQGERSGFGEGTMIEGAGTVVATGL